MADNDPIRIGRTNNIESSNRGTGTVLERPANSPRTDAAFSVVARNPAGADGIYGEASANKNGVTGRSANGFGVLGSSTNSVGVGGGSISSNGVQGVTNSGVGVSGLSDSSFGVQGFSTNDVGVRGIGGAQGVSGSSVSSFGVQGLSTDSVGVAGFSTNSTGVQGFSNSSLGVAGFSNNNNGVTGVSTNSLGVAGFSTNSTGVQGSSNSGLGVAGFSTTNFGVQGISTSGAAVRARSDSGPGVHSETDTGIGVFGICKSPDPSHNQWAGVFVGGIQVIGDIQQFAGNKPFTIDHPLDPENKYLVHASVESPDRKNIYDGVARLDKDGAAWVELPEWFEALNEGFRYQLTAIGGAAPNLHVAEVISGNRFKISGGEGGMNVCWQVTGSRKDPWAAANPFVVEQEKREEDRGRYIDPSLYDAPEEQRIMPLLAADVVEAEQQAPEPSGIDFVSLEGEHRGQMDELRRVAEEQRQEIEELRRRMGQQEEATRENT